MLLSWQRTDNDTRAARVMRAMNDFQTDFWTLGEDNEGQLIIYTGLKFDENGQVVPFEDEEKDCTCTLACIPQGKGEDRVCRTEKEEFHVCGNFHAHGHHEWSPLLPYLNPPTFLCPGRKVCL